jgi:hypothetical protein
MRRFNAFLKGTLTMSDDYNGWKNFETWTFRCYLDNDASTATFWGDEAKRCYREAVAEKHFTRDEVAAFALRDLMQESLEEQVAKAVDAEKHPMVAQLLNGAASEVNVFEVAKNWIEAWKDQA